MNRFVKMKLVFVLFLLIPGVIYSSDKITIIYTNSLNGNIDFCHCKESPNGGLVKRATEINKLRHRYKNLFLFETGDMFYYEKDSILAKYIVKAYKYMGYDAVTFGDQEFSVGVSGFLKYRDELPFVNNNIRIKYGKRFRKFFKRYMIVRKSNFKIGIIGTVSRDTFKYYPSKLRSKIKISNQVNEIISDISILKGKKVDVIILLSHSGFDKDKVIAKRVRGIDIIIGGHSQTFLKNPKKIGKTIIVQAGSNGAHIGILEIFRKGSKALKFRNSFRRPDEYQPADDKYIRKLINDYKEESRKKNNLRFD
ncbi:bifunctional metallophosphatase/5'-nucleotidase [Spirochaetota bacterium]